MRRCCGGTGGDSWGDDVGRGRVGERVPKGGRRKHPTSNTQHPTSNGPPADTPSMRSATSLLSAFPSATWERGEHPTSNGPPADTPALRSGAVPRSSVRCEPHGHTKCNLGTRGFQRFKTQRRRDAEAAEPTAAPPKAVVSTKYTKKHENNGLAENFDRGLHGFKAALRNRYERHGDNRANRPNRTYAGMGADGESHWCATGRLL